MSLGGIAAGFDSTNPGDGDNEGLGAGVIRSFKTTVQQVLDSEHNFPAAGGANTGYHRLGSARPFYDVQSNVSSSGTDGRLQVTSDTSNLFHVGSAGTMFLGGARTISAGSDPQGGQRYFWAQEFGIAMTDGTGFKSITYPHSGFSGYPFTQLTQQFWNAGEGYAYVVVDQASANATTLRVKSVGSAGAVVSNITFNWQSTGTRPF